jgi:hypothetical protein
MALLHRVTFGRARSFWMDALDVPHTPGPCSTQATTPSLNKGQDRLPTGNLFLLLVAVHKTKSFGCWAASRSGNAIFALRITGEMTVESCLAGCLPAKVPKGKGPPPLRDRYRAGTILQRSLVGGRGYSWRWKDSWNIPQDLPCLSLWGKTACDTNICS